jgi:diguanylate cyclase (GGDEF)-like protein/PAS domain S-box-containing protein
VVGRVAAALFMLCGGFVALVAPILPSVGGVNRAGLELTALVAIGCGVGIWFLPWGRWSRSASLWLVPLAFLLIAVHDRMSGLDGHRYGLFYFVTFVWIGLGHRVGTSLRMAPLLVAAYLAPLLIPDRQPAAVLASAAYEVPLCVLLGETVAWVSEHLRRSQTALLHSEERFRSLVSNAADVISVVDANGRIVYDSPAIHRVLGYADGARIGTRAMDYVHPDDAPQVLGVFDRLGATAVVRRRVRVRHADGSWRWCDAVMRNQVDDPEVGGYVSNFSDVTDQTRAAEALRASNERLNAVIANTPIVLAAFDRNGVYTFLEGKALELTGVTPGELVGHSIFDVHRYEAETVDAARRVLAGEDVALVLQRGGHSWDVRYRPMRDSRGEVVGGISLSIDVSERVRAEDALRASGESFRRLFAANPHPMWVYDADTLAFLEVNQAAVTRYGYTREEFLAKRITDIRPPEDIPALLDDLQVRRTALEHSSAWRHVLKDGRLVDVEITSHALRFGDRDAVLVAVQDVTERNKLEDQLRHQAFHDSLTSLANRALFADRVEHALRRRAGEGASVALLLLDLDDFKTVNDSLGHSVGDELLVAIARRIESCLRPGDTAARIGGDEFVVLLEDVASEDDATLVAERLIEAVGTPVRLAGKDVVVHASCGIALGGEVQQADDLLRNADTAMYMAKASGRGHFTVFEPSMHAAAVERLELEADLRHAVEAGEFVVHYQPTIVLSTLEAHGVEALVRWAHPRRGLVPPGEFIPVAEKIGAIADIGRYVLREACTQAQRWRQTIAPVSVSVNLSGHQLADPDIVTDLSTVMLETGLDPALLTLEITESILMADTALAAERLRELKALGVVLAIDDFGTGYSSLSYLRTFPVDILKIDKSFVDVVTTDIEGASLVKAIVRLAGTLQLETVAEGVELAEQVPRLRGYGCGLAQGFHFSRPGPAAEIERLLRGAAELARGDEQPAVAGLS